MDKPEFIARLLLMGFELTPGFLNFNSYTFQLDKKVSWKDRLHILLFHDDVAPPYPYTPGCVAVNKDSRIRVFHIPSIHCFQEVLDYVIPHYNAMIEGVHHEDEPGLIDHDTVVNNWLFDAIDVTRRRFSDA